ncbi:MAG: hypothetical protein ABW000_07785 [Actinoplanes sp.]
MGTPRVNATIFDASALLALVLSGVDEFTPKLPERGVSDPPPLAGVWANPDNTVQLHLADDGSYESSVAGRSTISKGVYLPDGTGVLLRDESGLRIPVVVTENGLEMAGHRLFRV